MLSEFLTYTNASTTTSTADKTQSEVISCAKTQTTCPTVLQAQQVVQKLLETFALLQALQERRFPFTISLHSRT